MILHQYCSSVSVARELRDQLFQEELLGILYPSEEIPRFSLIARASSLS